MPSLQASLPPELADNVIRLYRECLRRAKYIGQQKHNTELLVNMVRQQFKRHKDETDPEKIQKLKDDAARGLASKGDVSTASTKCGETAMLVIDMQNDYVLLESRTRIVGANAIVSSVIEAVSVAREHGILVIWVVREHDKKGRDFELFRRHLYTDGVGPALQRSKGTELVEGLVIQDYDYKLVKTRFSAFFATNLDLLLKSCGINNLVVVGIQTPNCIRQTVFDAVSLDYKHVTVITDATAAATPEIHLANIEDMKNIGISTRTLHDWRMTFKL